MRSFLKFGAFLAFVVAVVGCGSPPQVELDAAQAALDSARQAGADTYAADAYNRAKNTLADAPLGIVAARSSAPSRHSHDVAASPKRVAIDAWPWPSRAIAAGDGRTRMCSQPLEVAFDTVSRPPRAEYENEPTPPPNMM